MIMAYAIYPKPHQLTCPTVASIKQVPVTIKHNNSWYSLQVSTFGTYDKWTVVISSLKGNNPEEIKKDAEKVLSTFSGTPKPVYENNKLWGEHWYCHYTNNDGKEIFAKTQPNVA